ncbi:MAG: hypothetical protein U0Y10_24455 [Spirosomataceae bacterium]
MKKTVSLLALLAFVSLSAFAQKTYVWDYYHIQITVPRDFRVKVNTNHDFEMKGDGMELAMHIFEQNVSIDDLDDATIEGAKALKLTEVDEATAVKVNELEGFYVEGFKDGNRIVFAGLGDPKSHTNFFIVITFDDDDKEAEKEAINIIKSLDVL